MIELLNNIFGIDNTISIPIIVSLIVFITGGLGRFVYKTISNYYSRRFIRYTFKNIINEIQKKCQIKANHIKAFYPTLKIENNNTWTVKLIQITYIELVYMQDYSLILNSYRKLFRFRCNSNLGVKAFNRIWANLENLKFIEKNMLEEFENFHKIFLVHEIQFSKLMEELRKLNDDYFSQFIGRKIFKSEFKDERLFHYLINRDKIIKEWQNHDKSTRKHRSVVFDKIVKPLRKLNKQNQDLEITMELNNILINAEHQYEEMKNILKVSHTIFYNYYRNYWSSFKIINKCLEIIT